MLQEAGAENAGIKEAYGSLDGSAQSITTPMTLVQGRADD